LAGSTDPRKQENEPSRRSHQRGIENPQGCRRRRRRFFAADPNELRIAVGRDSRRSAGVGRLARRQHRRGRAGAQPHPLRRDRLSVVHRRHSRPARTAGGPLLRDRILGKRLLFLGMLFVAAAVVGAMLVAFKDDPGAFASPAFRTARAISSNLVNVYMVRMAGVFMISTSTVAMWTHFAPRWLAALAICLRSCCCSAALSCAGASRSFRFGSSCSASRS
jgi:hypothetical protein